MNRLYDLRVIVRGNSITFNVTLSPDIDPSEFRTVVRGILFSALDAVDQHMPPDLTIEWGPTGSGQN